MKMKKSKCPLNKESYLLNHYKNGKDEVYLYERIDTSNNYKYCAGSFIPSKTTGGNHYTNDYKEAFNRYLNLKKEYQLSITYIQERMVLWINMKKN